MSTTRMAGDALKDPNFEARSRLSNDPEEAKRRASLVGSNYDVSGYSDKEISMALQGSKFGDEDYARLTGKTAGGEDKSPETKPPAAVIPAPSPGPSPVPTPIPDEPESSPIPIDLTGGGIFQDNDIYSTVTGNNNTVTNTQDNSILAKGLKDKYVLNLLNR